MSILTHDELLERKDDIFAAGTCVDSSFRPISYELRLADDDCLINGQYHPPRRCTSPYSDASLMEIPPGQLAFLSTKEVFDLAPDLIGRFGLKFRYVRLGLVPLLTTFIEPGSRGRLYFPVLNASSDTIILRPGEEIITVIFQRLTTPVDLGNPPSPSWDVLPTDIIDEHLKIRMTSSVELENRMKQLRRDLEYVGSGQERVIALAVTVITATILGAILQTIFGLYALTQNITASNQPSTGAWILIPSVLYCGSILFLVLLVGVAFAIRRSQSALETGNQLQNEIQ